MPRPIGSPPVGRKLLILALDGGDEGLQLRELAMCQVWGCALRGDPQATASQLLSWLQTDSSPTAKLRGIQGRCQNEDFTN
jgi:hypothetical protein